MRASAVLPNAANAWTTRLDPLGDVTQITTTHDVLPESPASAGVITLVSLEFDRLNFFEIDGR